MERYARAALVGTGYIGGSLLLALRRAGLVQRAVGCDASPSAARRAMERGIVDEVASDPAAAARGAELVVLATPVGATASVAAAIGSAAADARLLLDVGSTKTGVVAAVEAALPRPGRFVGTHPIAGREHHGPDAARADLFEGRACVITPTGRTEPEAIAACAALWSAVGARAVRLDAALHDRALALTSHLPHVAAFSLAAAAADALAADGALAAATPGLAGGSFTDTTRVAASPAPLWRDVLLANRDALLPLVDSLAATLAELRAALARGDGDALVTLLARAAAGRATVLAPAPAPVEEA